MFYGHAMLIVSIDDQRYAALTLQSLRVTIGPLQASTTSLESQESYLTAGMLPYNRNVTLQTFLSSTRDFYRLHSTFARLYNAAASPASRLRSAGSLAINKTALINQSTETYVMDNLIYFLGEVKFSLVIDQNGH